MRKPNVEISNPKTEKSPNEIIDSVDGDVRVASGIVHAARFALMNDEDCFDRDAIANALEAVENYLVCIGQEANQLFSLAVGNRERLGAQ